MRFHDQLHSSIAHSKAETVSTAAYRACIEGCDTGNWFMLYHGEPPGACGGAMILSNPLLLKGQQCRVHRCRVSVSKVFC